jgi:hypothetical protein
MTDDKIKNAIRRAANNAQASLALGEGEYYEFADLEQAYTSWFEDSVDVLLEECIPTATGTNRHGFNSRALNLNSLASQTIQVMSVNDLNHLQSLGMSLQPA